MKLAILLTLLAMCELSIASTIEGKVVRVSDGDTITLLDEAKTQSKVRLNRIDAPEKKQAFGEVSRKHLASFVTNGIVKVEWAKKDKYGRILGDVFVGELNVNLQMVKDGLAWHYKNFDNTKEFAIAENEARK